MTTDFRNTDWIKEASSAAKLDKEQIEKTFGDQAYSYIAAKAGPLMEEKYLLGFEVIHHNEDNTRLVGIYAFRVKDQLLYAPIFYINGQIKGDHFLYNVQTKLFKALTEERATKFTKEDSSSNGTAQSRQDTDKSRFGTNLTSMMYPPWQLKQAFFEIAEGQTPETALTAMFCPKDTNIKAGSLLKEFIAKGGIKCASFIHETIKSSGEFTEALIDILGDEFENTIFPDLQAPVKSASTESGGLWLHTGMIKAAMTQPQREQFLKYGYSLQDDRNPDEKAEVYSMGDTLESVRPGGVYNLPIVSEHPEQSGLIGGLKDLNGFSRGRNFSYPSAMTAGDYNSTENRVGVYFSKSKALRTDMNADQITGAPVIDIKLESDTEGDAKPKVGKSYAIYDAGDSSFARRPVYISGIKDSPLGGKVLIAHELESYGIGHGIQLLWNPDTDTSEFVEGILSSKVRFLPVETETMPDGNYPCGGSSASDEISVKDLPNIRCVAAPTILPTKLTLDAFASVGTHGVKVRLKGGDFEFEFGKGRVKRAESHMEAAAYMSGMLCVDAEETMEFLAKVAAAPGQEHTIFIGTNEKNASSVTRLVSQPNLQPSFDSRYAVNTDDPKQFRIGTTTFVPQVRTMQADEAADPSLGGGKNQDHIPTAELMVMSPSQISTAVKSRGLPFAFEHGVVGSMVDTFDAGHMIDEYLPALETGLDRLGRLLFLFYWKPQDYEKIYGADELSQRENQLLSNFLSLDKCLLDIQKKPKGAHGGSGALS